MSVAATTWAWEQDIPFGEKLVLLGIADWCTEGDGCYYSATKLAGKIGMSVRAFRDNVARLEEKTLLNRYERLRDNGSRTSNVIVLTRLAPDERCTADAAGGGISPVSSGTAAPATRHGPAGEPRRDAAGPETERKRQTLSSSTSQTILDVTGLSTEAAADVASLLRAKPKVAGKLVTGDEAVLAAIALSAFNAAAESEYGLAAHLGKFVARIRERPAFGADDHRRLIASAWRLRWWERASTPGRRPSPSVIYGNAGVFEQVIQDAADEKRGRSVAEPEPKRFVRKGPVKEL